jgi:hypothetical protein
VANSLLQLSETFNPTEALSMHEEKSTDVMQDSPEMLFDCEWPELNARGLYAKRTTTMSVWEEDREYCYFFEKGEFKGATLKTPHFVRYASP